MSHYALRLYDPDAWEELQAEELFKDVKPVDTIMTPEEEDALYESEEWIKSRAKARQEDIQRIIDNELRFDWYELHDGEYDDQESEEE